LGGKAIEAAKKSGAAAFLETGLYLFLDTFLPQKTEAFIRNSIQNNNLDWQSLAVNGSELTGENLWEVISSTVSLRFALGWARTHHQTSNSSQAPSHPSSLQALNAPANPQQALALRSSATPA